jgi:hypothetical protein
LLGSELFRSCGMYLYFFYTPRILNFIQAEANLAKPAYGHSLLEKYASP